MSIHPNSVLHYRTAFDIESVKQDDGVWTDVVKKIRAWISSRFETDEQFGRSWFYVGGEWSDYANKRICATTRSLKDNDTDEVPEFWSIRFEHPCNDVKIRTWQTDIGITRLRRGLFRFVLTTSHRLTAQYFMGDVTQPVPSAPAIVGNLLRSRTFECRAGSARLSPFLIQLRNGDGKTFVEAMEDSGRICPIVLVTLPFRRKDALIDAGRLANQVRGIANVYVAADSDVDKELEYFLKPRFRCWNGAVRVYHRKADQADPADSIRHRFFLPDDIMRRGAEQVEDMIVRGIARYGPLYLGNVVANIEDVALRYRRQRFRDLKSKVAAGPATNVEDLWEFLNEQDNQISELKDDRDRLESERESIEEKLDQTEYQIESLQFNLTEANKKAARLSKATSGLPEMPRLPNSVSEVIDVMENLFPGRLYFTEKAKRSAGECSLNEPAIAWEALYDMGKSLYDLYFSGTGESTNIRSDFENSSRFELSLSESKQTRSDKRFMTLRTQIYDDSEIVLEAHVKYGKRSPKLLRIYYWPDHEKQLLVIGHCGDHLDNFSSRKKK